MYIFLKNWKNIFFTDIGTTLSSQAEMKSQDTHRSRMISFYEYLNCVEWNIEQVIFEKITKGQIYLPDRPKYWIHILIFSFLYLIILFILTETSRKFILEHFFACVWISILTINHERKRSRKSFVWCQN